MRSRSETDPKTGFGNRYAWPAACNSYSITKLIGEVVRGRKKEKRKARRKKKAVC
jgi:hypothetical protein